MGKIKIVCEYCGKVEYDFPSNFKKYCSRKCTTDALRKRIQCKCLGCGNLFEVRPSEYKKGFGKHCSVECRSKNLDENRTCLFCGKQFSIRRHRLVNSGARGKFCSNKCASSYRANLWSNRYEKCIECGLTKYKHQGLGLCRRCYGLKKKYLLGNKERLKLYKKAESRCMICGKSESKNGRKLAVDHSHNNSNIRGLLCDECNRGLGYFKDDPKLLDNAIKYLEKTI